MIPFGSNAGTCEALASNLANTASGSGFKPNVMPLDEAIDKLPPDQPVLIITSSYEGEPPDNAKQLVEWLQRPNQEELKDVEYAVFGCGNRTFYPLRNPEVCLISIDDWTSTFHRIPKLVDQLLAERGATRIAEKGLSDVVGGHVFDDFDHWQDDLLWPAIRKIFNMAAEVSKEKIGLDITLHPLSRANDLRQGVSEAMVNENILLTAPDAPQKRHLSLQLPSNMTYTPGTIWPSYP